MESSHLFYHLHLCLSYCDMSLYISDDSVLSFTVYYLLMLIHKIHFCSVRNELVTVLLSLHLYRHFFPILRSD